MRLSCPACGAELTLDVLLTHEAARRAVAAAMHISAPLADRLMKYLALFRPAQRQLSMDRVASLLEELLPMIRDQRVKRGHRECSTILDNWTLALDTVLTHRDDKRLTLPLKSHGYLLEVICGLCERREAGQEKAREERLRSGQRDHADREKACDTVAALAAQARLRTQDRGPTPEGPPNELRPEGGENSEAARQVLDWITRRKRGGVT